MERVVINGATGCIGLALIKEFVECGVEVLVLAHNGSKRNKYIPHVPQVRVEYCDLNQLCMFNTNERYDVFYNLAWIGGKYRDDVLLQESNIQYALDAVKLAARLGCKRFIGTGSQAEYGLKNKKLTSSMPANPVSAFGASKLYAGKMCEILAHQLGMDFIWTRILSVYGPYDGMQTMVMSLISQLRKGIVPELTGCEQMWDYLYSGDAAKALYLMGEKGKNGKIYVLGGGSAKPLINYVEDIRSVVNAECDIAVGKIPYSENQVMYLCADVSELEEDTGWHATTKFQDGIKFVLDSMNGGI